MTSVEATRRTLGLSAEAFGFSSRFRLSNQPLLSSLRVEVDGVLVEPRSPSGTTNWQHDPGTNAVNFTSFATPEPGARLRVQYEVACLP